MYRNVWFILMLLRQWRYPVLALPVGGCAAGHLMKGREFCDPPVWQPHPTASAQLLWKTLPSSLEKAQKTQEDWFPTSKWTAVLPFAHSPSSRSGAACTLLCSQLGHASRFFNVPRTLPRDNHYVLLTLSDVGWYEKLCKGGPRNR